jgi:hypothetical protein
LLSWTAAALRAANACHDRPQIAHLSRLVRLAPGDLIMMGTPEGVGPVVRGDTLHAAIDGCGACASTMAFACVRAPELRHVLAWRVCALLLHWLTHARDACLCVRVCASLLRRSVSELRFRFDN